MPNDIALVHKITRAATLANLLHVPCHFFAGALPDGFARATVSALGKAANPHLAFHFLDAYWSRDGHVASRPRNPIVHALWEAASAKPLGKLELPHVEYVYREVGGFPVACHTNHGRAGYCQSPATDEELIGLARGGSWLFQANEERLCAAVPDKPVPASFVVDSRTRALIKDIRSLPGCRAHVLWGPPRAGKSVAAKQIADAIGEGSWARICGDICAEASVWKALEVLRPKALIIDDIDVNAGEESALMSGLEAAREWARVIISTANVVPKAGQSPDASTVRGAVIGRASDGALVEYRTLSDEVQRVIAPDVFASEFETGDLLAKYQVELQRRFDARGLTQADVDEQRELQALVGER